MIEKKTENQQEPIFKFHHTRSQVIIIFKFCEFYDEKQNPVWVLNP